MDEFLAAFFKLWPHAVFQFEDFMTPRAFLLLDRFRKKYRCFNDDIQGTGVVVAAGIKNALRALPKSFENSQIRFLFFGAGSAAVGIADSCVDMLMDYRKMSREDAINSIYLVDSQGLVTKWRENRGGKPLADHKIRYARDDMKQYKQQNLTDLVDIINAVKPCALLGLSSVPKAFSESVITCMASHCERPIIFALSNPNSKAECDAATAYKCSNGKAIFASGSPWDPVTLHGQTFYPSQANNMFCFPGIGLGTSISQATRISKEMLHAAASALADMVPDSEIAKGSLYPPINSVREASAHVAAAVAEQAVKQKLSFVVLEENETWIQLARDFMWTPSYQK